MQAPEWLANFWKTQAVIALAAIQMYIIVSEWAKSMMRPCEASKRRAGKVWIRGFLYGKHLHWSWRYCAFTGAWLRYLQNYRASAAAIAHPPCPGTLFWGTQGCKSMFRSLSTFSKVVTLFSGGYSKQTFETTVLFSSVWISASLWKQNLVDYSFYISFRMVGCLSREGLCFTQISLQTEQDIFRLQIAPCRF